MTELRVKQQSVIELINKELQEGKGMDAMSERFRNCVIVQALTLTQGNVSRAAVILKIRRNRLVCWMVKSGITRYWRTAPNLGD